MLSIVLSHYLDVRLGWRVPYNREAQRNDVGSTGMPCYNARRRVWRIVGAMKVLLIGNGGREHALAWKLVQSPRLTELLIAPGNPGTALWGRNVPVRADDVPGLVRLAASESVDLVVVGPEVPLAAGLADALGRAGIACFGPTQAAATIESSKAFAKT